MLVDYQRRFQIAAAARRARMSERGGRVIMVYAVTHGTDRGVERRPTASQCLELVMALQARNEPQINIADENGAEITLADLEERHKREVELTWVFPKTGHDNTVAQGPTPTRASYTEPTRRGLLYMTTAATGAVGLAATMIPLIDQINPDASAIGAGGPIDFDLGGVEPGKQAVVRWRARPIFVVFRTSEMLETLKDPRLLNQLADPQSKQVQQPPYADNWYRSLIPEIGVFVGICTHLGCIPQFEPLASASEPVSKWVGGYFCPCHGSMYDFAGRVFRDMPAPYNLAVPPYRFLSDTVIRIGENPLGSNFDFSTVEQI